MLSSLSTRFRPFIWFLIVSFVISSTPHIELLFPYTVKLTGSEAHAAEGSRMSSGNDTGGDGTGVALPGAETSLFSGAAATSIPVVVPPGRKGMAPPSFPQL